MLPAMTSTHAVSKLALVPDSRAGSTRAAANPVRRYRLARLQIDSRSAERASRFEHLKRIFD